MKFFLKDWNLILLHLISFYSFIAIFNICKFDDYYLFERGFHTIAVIQVNVINKIAFTDMNQFNNLSQLLYNIYTKEFKKKLLLIPCIDWAFWK